MTSFASVAASRRHNRLQIPFGGGAVRTARVDGRAAVPGDRLPEVTMLSVGSRYFDTIGVATGRGARSRAVMGGQGGRSRS